MSKTSYRRCTCDPCATIKLMTGKSPPITDKELNDIKLNLFTERNNDNTFYLILHGKDIFQRYLRRLTDQDMKAICRYIRNSSRRITVLDLSYNRITDVGFKHLIKNLLIRGSSVVNLNVMENNLTAKSTGYLAKYASVINLKCLRLTGNMIGSEEEGGIYLADFLVNNKTLECLDVGETQFNFSSLANICSALRIGQGENTTLKYLDLSRLLPLFNRYDLEPKWVIYHIQILLENNTTLRELHLQKNELTGHDMESLVQGLAKNSTLRCLDLGYNRIGTYGLEVIGKFFESGSGLVYLNVAGNSISDDGAVALSYGLPYTTIRALDISQNYLSENGIMSLLYIARKPFMLRFLNIWGNQIGESACKLIRRLHDSGVLFQNGVDVRVYEQDGRYYAAYYPNPSDRNKHMYYNVTSYAHAQPIYHIKRNVKTFNKIEYLDGKHRHKPETAQRCNDD